MTTSEELIEIVARAITIADNCDPDTLGYAVRETTERELGKSYPLWKYRINQAKAAVLVIGGIRK